MKTSSKLFGGSHILHLSSPEDKKEILQHLHINTNIQLPEKTRQMKLLSNHNIPILKNEYYAMAVPDDLDVFLYFTKYKGVNRCFLICRQLGPGYTQPKILLLFPKCVDSSIYSETLIEATRVYVTDNRFVILMNDIQWYKGEKLNSKNLIERLQCLGEFMKDCFKEDLNQFPFRLQITTPYEHLNLLEQRLSNLPYKVNRILFVPSYKKQSSVLYYPIST